MSHDEVKQLAVFKSRMLSNCLLEHLNRSSEFAILTCVGTRFQSSEAVICELYQAVCKLLWSGDNV